MSSPRKKSINFLGNVPHADESYPFPLILKGLFVSESWGVIGHSALGRLRSRRDLDLSAAVRFANDYSLPGIAGLSFLRSIVWSLIGIDFANAQEKKGKYYSPAVAAEAIEALACWHIIKDSRVDGDRAYRIRGSQKLLSIKDERPTAKRLARGRGYVSQPIRMGMGACLPSLGLVDAQNSRFNSYKINDRGREFLKHSLGNADSEKAVPKLWDWLKRGVWQTKGSDRELGLIDPMTPLPAPAIRFFSEIMLNVGDPEDLSTRRSIWTAGKGLLEKNPALEGDEFVDALGAYVGENDNATHARLEWASDFFSTYSEAFSVLDQIQVILSDIPTRKASVALLLNGAELNARLEILQRTANRLAARAQPDAAPSGLRSFLAVATGNDHAAIIHDLVRRDGIVLQLEGEIANLMISLRPGQEVGNSDDIPASLQDEAAGDPSQLYRLHNLCRLSREVWIKQ